MANTLFLLWDREKVRSVVKLWSVDQHFQITLGDPLEMRILRCHPVRIKSEMRGRRGQGSVFSHPSGGQSPRTTELGCTGESQCSAMTDGAQENHPTSVKLTVLTCTMGREPRISPPHWHEG